MSTTSSLPAIQMQPTLGAQMSIGEGQGMLRHRIQTHLAVSGAAQPRNQWTMRRKVINGESNSNT